MRGLIVNIIISAVAFFAGFQVFHALPPESEAPPAGSSQSTQTEGGDFQKRFPDLGPVRFSNYNVIGEKNLFRAERREWTPPPKSEQGQDNKDTPKPPPPQLTLYGTIVYGDDVRVAIIKGGGGRGGAGEERMSYRLGDVISGYSIKDIKEDKVMLARGDDVMELKLREGKSRPAAPAAPPQPQRRPEGVMMPPGVTAPAGAMPPPGGMPAAGMVAPPGMMAPVPSEAIKPGEEPERIVVKGPGGKDIVKRKKVIRTPFGPKTIYIEER